MTKKLAEEIGGYFGIDLPYFGDHFPDMLKYQSARSALRAVLEHVKAKKVLLPIYICDSVIQSVYDAGVKPIFYNLDDQLLPKDLPCNIPNYYLLYPNYFGLNDYNISTLLKQWPNDKLIIDNSQALFSQPSNAFATIYSPRKFIGLPDGGLLYAPSLSISEPSEEDRGSVDRIKYLFLRSAYSAREGYSEFLEAEHTLKKTSPLAMSQITRLLLSSIDIESIKKIRRENYQIISKKLNQYNSKSFSLQAGVVPLCYPLTLSGYDVSIIKSKLIENNVFLPTYWPEIKNRTALGSVERLFIENTLFVPIDQRMSLHSIDTECKALELELCKVLR